MQKFCSLRLLTEMQLMRKKCMPTSLREYTEQEIVQMVLIYIHISLILQLNWGSNFRLPID
jgi:hypothetical protein